MVMPWLATGPDCVTVLHTTEHRWTTITDPDGQGRVVRRPLRLTKLITEDAIEDYDSALLYRASAWRLDGVGDFAGLLAHLEPQANACIIRGTLKREFAAHEAVYRRYAEHHGDTAAFAPAARQWLMVELDSIPCPPGVDPVDPELAGGAARLVLPAAFRSARCAVQLSSGAGIKSGLRVHLWFRLSRPISDAEAKRWLKGAPVDLSIYQPVQPHYTAAPIFDGCDAPCFERLALLPGYDAVQVPDLPDPERPRAVFNPSLSGHLGSRGAGGAERYAAACLRRLALAPEGRRHQTCVGVACCLLAVSKAGLLNPATVAAQIKGVMLGKGFDGRSGRDLSEVDRILEWAWQTVEPKGLPR
jgi:hypothetical protein